ncbi:MAG: hypothetical protein HKN05_06475 [Rhizobiales bacterium]|nr:hypothetical protein [Hyphomicrobiales bacterium]
MDWFVLRPWHGPQYPQELALKGLAPRVAAVSIIPYFLRKIGIKQNMNTLHAGLLICQIIVQNKESIAKRLLPVVKIGP